VGLDAARRVDYTYNALNHATAPGLPVSVTLPRGAVESFGYDARGNLSATETPLGFRGEVLSGTDGVAEGRARLGGPRAERHPAGSRRLPAGYDR
jgi:YD repeat-containing protein